MSGPEKKKDNTEAQIRIRLPKDVKRWLALRALNNDISIQQIVYGLIHQNYSKDPTAKRAKQVQR